MSDLNFEAVSKSFGDVAVLRAFSLRVPEGQTVWLMAPSGRGKTTALRLAAGLLQPDAGRVTGSPARISALFQENRLIPSLTAVENIRFVTGKACDEKEILRHLALLGLAEAAGRPAAQLSGGMQRRVAIARAVLFGGGLFLLDEPFQGLDEETKKAAVLYLKQGISGKTVLAVTHDVSDVSSLGGTIVRL